MIAISVGSVAHKPALIAPAPDGSDSMTLKFGHIVVLVDRATAVDMARKIDALDAAMTEADYEAAKESKNVDGTGTEDGKPGRELDGRRAAGRDPRPEQG